MWGIASNLPAVVAPIAGGAILARVLPAASGYRVLSLVAAACPLAGSALAMASRVRAPGDRRWVEASLQWVVTSILRAYVGLLYDVRVVGALPEDRPGALFAANHQHDLEGMVIPARIFLHAPGGGGVYAAASPRLFEPGFLATRAPRWLGRWLGPLSLAPVMRALGVLPVENMPLARPLASWAYWVHRRHGELRAPRRSP